MKIFLSTFISLSLLGSLSQARVFNITNESFASYFSGNMGPLSLQKAPFENESTGGVNHDTGFSSVLGGEFGFLYATSVFNLRFGIGIIKPAALKGVQASVGGSTLYVVGSDILGFVPKMGIEANFKRAPSYRVFGIASFGLANITMKNEYALTAAGQSAYVGVIDHTVDAKGSATEMYGGVGGEIHMTDTTTFLIEAGYRSLKFTNLSYSKDVTTFTGAQPSGAPVLNILGNQRTFDFSGVLVSIGLRFYM